VWVDHARYVDVKWSGHMSRSAKVAVIDPGPNPATPVGAAGASPGQPRIITRAQWGADESIRKCCPEYADPLQMVFIHHTATTNSYNAQDSAAIVRSIYAYHVKNNGWQDIGYHLLVDKFGQIFEGRYGGLDRALVGAQTLGFNAHSAGIAVIGTFNSSGPPAAAMTALKQITAWRMDRANIDPSGATTMISAGNPRYAAGRAVSLRTISGHRDVYDTDCPGNAFYPQLPSLRSAVTPYGDPKLFLPPMSSAIITPNGDGVADFMRLSGRFTSSVSWRADVIDPSGHIWATARGSGTTLSTSWTGQDAAHNQAPQDKYLFTINASNGHGSIRTVSVPVYVWRFPNGTLFQTPSGWTGVLGGQQVRHIVAPRALLSQYALAEALPVREDVKRLYPAGSDIGFREGSVVRADGLTWIISDGQRRPIDPATFAALGYDSNSIIDTTSDTLAMNPTGTPVTADGGYPDGTALRSSDTREAVVLAGMGRPYLTTNVRTSYAIRDFDLAGPADSQVTNAQTNPPVGFRDGTLIRMIGDGAVYVIADGIRRHITSRHLFDVMGYKNSNIRAVTPAELALHPEGAPVS
jgi:hypothetical protein